MPAKFIKSDEFSGHISMGTPAAFSDFLKVAAIDCALMESLVEQVN
jgi:hypothetical protein